MEAAALSFFTLTFHFSVSLFNFLSFLFLKSFGALFCSLGCRGGSTAGDTAAAIRSLHLPTGSCIFFVLYLFIFIFSSSSSSHRRRYSSTHQKSSSANRELHIFRSFLSDKKLRIFSIFHQPTKNC